MGFRVGTFLKKQQNAHIFVQQTVEPAYVMVALLSELISDLMRTILAKKFESDSVEE